MALPSRTEVQTLNYVGPFGPLISIAGTGTETEAIGPFGPVFVLPSSAGSSDPANVIYIKTASNTWSQATNVYIKTASNTWSVVNNFNIKTSSGWET